MNSLLGRFFYPALFEICVFVHASARICVRVRVLVSVCVCVCAMALFRVHSDQGDTSLWSPQGVSGLWKAMGVTATKSNTR